MEKFKVMPYGMKAAGVRRSLQAWVIFVSIRDLAQDSAGKYPDDRVTTVPKGIMEAEENATT
jgi:hypothetical protein